MRSIRLEQDAGLLGPAEPGLNFLGPAISVLWRPALWVVGGIAAYYYIPKSVKESIGLDTSKIPFSTVLGGLSYASFTLAEQVGEPVAPVLKLGGIALGGWSILNLFSGETKPKEFEYIPTPALPAGANLNWVIGDIVSPKEGELVKPTGVQILNGVEYPVYPVKVKLMNYPNSKDVLHNITIRTREYSDYFSAPRQGTALQPLMPLMDGGSLRPLRPGETFTYTFMIPQMRFGTFSKLEDSETKLSIEVNSADGNSRKLDEHNFILVT